MSTVIVSGSDDNFLPLAKGLWLSILDAVSSPDVALVWVDIGVSDETRRWLSANAPQVEQVAIPTEFGRDLLDLAPSRYHRAALIRPLLPQLLPGHDVIVWLDADTWVQDGASIDVLRETVLHSPEAVALAAFFDVSYEPLFTFPVKFIEEHITPVWRGLYGDEVAEDFRDRPLLSSGVLALHTESPFWSTWYDECRRVYGRAAHLPPNIVHVAEQTTLNYVAYTTGCYVALEAVHNYHASIGSAVRNERDGKVVTSPPASREIGILHLSDIVNHGRTRRYLEEGLFYDRGAYLTPGDVEALAELRRS